MIGQSGTRADGSDPPSTKGGWRTVVVGVGCALVLAVVALAVLNWAVTDGLGLATAEDINTDDSEMAVTTERLNTVGEVLNDLPAYEGTTAEAAEQGGCVTDSGDLFQPQISRVWSVQSAPEAVAAAIGTDLAGLGWTVSARNHVGVQELIYESDGGWFAQGSLFPTYERDAVVVEVRIRDAELCSLD